MYKLIRTSANEWKFFLKMSDAEVEKTILEKVGSVREVMTTETGIPPSVSIGDVKDYLTEVLDELHKDRERERLKGSRTPHNLTYDKANGNLFRFINPA